jgi:ribose transport system substrate-binding protein
MKLRPKAALATVLAGVLLTAACGADAAPSTSAEVPAGLLASAKENLAPYTGHPSPFPVTEPLAHQLPPGTTFAFLQCSTPVCAQFATTAQQAAAAVGAKLTVTRAGASAQALQQAMGSIVAAKPAAVLIPAADPVQYRDQMDQLAAAGIPVVTQGVVDGDEFAAIKGGELGKLAAGNAGKLLADWTVVRAGARPSVFYTVPELSFSAFILDGYQHEMTRLCPSCAVRVVKVPVGTIGNTAPSTIVADLRSHPETQVAVAGSEEAFEGLPSALDVAGITVTTTGFAPDTTVLGYIKNGQITGGLGYDNVTSTWVQVDEAARLVTGQPLTDREKNDQLVFQFLEKGDIADAARPYTGYPDVADRFAKLWSGQS